MYLLEEIKGQCLIVLSFCLYYNVDKQVNTDNKHKSFTVLVRFFCLDTVGNSHQSSQSKRAFTITPNTEGSPRNSHRVAYNGCIIVQKIPLKFSSGYIVVRI